MSEALSRAIRAIDDAHAADPIRVDGVAAELRYADGITRWIGRLVERPSDALVLAARAQHLERWAIARDAFPMDRTGYFKWRKAIQERQRERVIAILGAAGVDAELAVRVGSLVAKGVPRGDPEGQALEDAACLVFFESELEKFAREHTDYTREKFLDIVRKTWVKMSPQAQRLARELPLAEPLRALITAAVD